MGTKSTKERKSGGSNVFDEEIISMLRTMNERDNKYINAQFLKLKKVFKKFDTDNSGTVEIGELHAAINALSENNTASKEDVDKLFAAADTDSDGHLTFKEFLVYMALGYILKKIPQSPREGKEVDASGMDLSTVFEYVIDAFLAFDTDASGYIDKKEVMAMFDSTPSAVRTKGAHHASRNIIGKQRWAQMDWDRNGRISFKEFLLAFSTWTGLDDALDDDDDE
eukprot:g4136.t1